MLLAYACLAYGTCAARTYYVDAQRGDDAAAGTSEAAAWRSITKLSQREWRAGDRLLIRRGTEYVGSLWPKGSGNAAEPIVVDSYGHGALPKIHAIRGGEAAFRLFDQEYWTVEHLEFIGGEPHGVYVSGSHGVLHGIHLRGLVVHGVTGEPQNKEGGLVVIAPGDAGQRFDDVLVDGVTAYGTTQWAGIMVGGVEQGFLPDTARSSHVTVRNSTVHDVAGDGIVLFQVNYGAIENSVAWHTGMQQTESIGTPNAIWTWMCRQCAVRRCEAFLTDSPGVDGGAFDIDYGDDDNAVEDSYGHDTQGYCIAVFGAGGVTTDSIVRRNTCAGNGRSPRLAAAQGAVYLKTWNGGRLKGLDISRNRIFWFPPIAAAAVVNTAAFNGSGTFSHNTIASNIVQIARGNDALQFADNTVERQPPPIIGSPISSIGKTEFPDARGNRVALGGSAGPWRLYGCVPRSGDGLAILTSAWRQFHASGLDLFVVVPAGDRESLEGFRDEWHLEEVPLLLDTADRDAPATFLVDKQGKIAWHAQGLLLPGDLGLALRANLGDPDYALLISEP